MKMGRHLRGSRGALPRGFWFACLALASQVLLPFLLAFDIALAAPLTAGDNAVTLCSVSHTTSAPTSSGEGRTGHHSSPGNCPICQALSAGHAYTQPPPIILPVPTNLAVILGPSAPNESPTIISAVLYRSRAPPSSV